MSVSNWKELKSEVISRPRGWIRRFGDNLTTDRILEPKLSIQEATIERWRAQGWKRVEIRNIIKPENPPELPDLTVIPEDNIVSTAIRCMYCWDPVSAGAERVTCGHCRTVMCHRYCITDIKKYFVPSPSNGTRSKCSLRPEVEDYNRRDSGGKSMRHLPSQKSTEMSKDPLPPPLPHPSIRRINWFCLLCQHEVRYNCEPCASSRNDL